MTGEMDKNKFIGCRTVRMFTYEQVGSQTDKDLWANNNHVDIVSYLCVITNTRSSEVAGFLVEKWLTNAAVHFATGLKFCHAGQVN